MGQSKEKLSQGQAETKLGTYIITGSEIRRIVRSVGLNNFMDEAIRRVEEGFIDFGNGNILRERRIGFPLDGATIEAMPVRRIGEAALFKIVNFHERNPEQGLPTIMGTSVYMDEKTGFPLAIVDATLLTAIRTGATTGLATKYLYPDARTIGLIGTGAVGQASLHAITRVCDVEKIFIWDTNQVVLERFKRQTSAFLKIPMEIKTPEEIVQSAQVITTCTYGNEIVVKDEWIRPGEIKLINAVGGDTPGKCEVDPRLYKRANIIVDFKEQAVREGDVLNPLTQGIISENDIYAELPDIVSGKMKVPKRHLLTVFDSTGDPIEDLVMVELVLERGNFKRKRFTFIPKRRSDFYGSI